MVKKDKKPLFLGPVIAIILMTGLLIILSAIFSWFGLSANQTEIANGTLETSLVSVNNLLSKDGFTYIMGNMVNIFANFKPLVLLIITLIALGIGEASGLFKDLFSKLKKLNPKFLTLIVLLTGVIATFIGDYSYIILLPLAGIVYKYADKKPAVGIITAFIGITLGYGIGILPSYNSYLLGNLTEMAAVINVDKAYAFDLFSPLFFTIFATIILVISGAILIDKKLGPKFNRAEYEDDGLVSSKKGLLFSNLAFILLSLLTVYAIVPFGFGSGFLLGEGDRYLVRLFGESSPFNQGFVCIVLFIIMICSYIYGKVSNNIKNTNDYSVGLSKEFKGTGYVFVLIFFASLFLGILDYSNIGVVLANKLVNLVSIIPFTGVPLIIIVIVAFILMSILIPDSLTKWTIASPVIVPLLMRANITPDFTLLIFKLSDGIGKCFTPIFIYFIIMLAFLQKYNNREENKITILATLRKIWPTVSILSAILIVLLIGWYIIGLPIGLNIHPTL